MVLESDSRTKTMKIWFWTLTQGAGPWNMILDSDSRIHDNIVLDLDMRTKTNILFYVMDMGACGLGLNSNLTLFWSLSWLDLQHCFCHITTETGTPEGWMQGFWCTGERGRLSSSSTPPGRTFECPSSAGPPPCQSSLLYPVLACIYVPVHKNILKMRWANTCF